MTTRKHFHSTNSVCGKKYQLVFAKLVIEQVMPVFNEMVQLTNVSPGNLCFSHQRHYTN